MRAMRALVAQLKKKKYAAVDSSPARTREPETAAALLRDGSGTRLERTHSHARDAKQPGGATLEQHAAALTAALELGSLDFVNRTRQAHAARAGKLWWLSSLVARLRSR